ncbi:MAG: type 1 glutamine amidotransferase [Campylobacterales bacterium]
MARVAVLIEELVEDAEFIYPFYRLQEAGYEVRVLAPRPGTYQGKHGGSYPAKYAADPEDAEGYDALFIPGGYAPDRLRRSEKVLELVRRIHDAGKPVAAVCHAPWVLISAGVVKGRNVTAFASIRDDLTNAGAIYTGRSAEFDGNLITATDPSALPEMMRLFLKQLMKGSVQ